MRHGRYIGLDFGHLVELKVLDSRLRALVLSFCLDIEEALKVRINRAAMEAGVGPYALTREYLEAARASVVSDQLARYDREAALLRECKSMLRQAQGMRNAAAHNDAMLNTLSAYRTSSYLKGCRRKLRERGIEGPWVDAVASVPVAMELAAVLICHESLVERQGARELAARGMRSLSERLEENVEWFSKSYPISSFIEYASRLLRELASRADA